MADSFSKLKELDLTQDEVDRLGEALKKEEFRKLLVEYVEDVQKPENRRLYQEEVILLERERGVDVTFVNPEPGYVIKTSVDGRKKGFINVCSSESVAKPAGEFARKDGGQGLEWAVPHSVAPPRDDMDNKGAHCVVYDVVFHPDALLMASKNAAFHTMLNSIACDALESNFQVSLDKKNLKFPKLKYKGLVHPTVFRKPIKDFIAQPLNPEEKDFMEKLYPKPEPELKKKPRKASKKNVGDDKSAYTVPNYVIKHRSHADVQDCLEDKHSKLYAATPKQLIIEVDLPLLKSSSDITLDVTEKTLQLISEKPSKYKLAITLPYRVNQDNGNAKFEKDQKKLIVTLPVKRYNFYDGTREDSGVESDQGSPVSAELPEPDIFSDSALRTSISFLDDSYHYDLPDHTCHTFDKTLAFTLHVKNVSESSICKEVTANSFHVKFSSISSGFYSTHYAIFVELVPEIVNMQVEVWDNNVIVQVETESDALTQYKYGLTAVNLQEKYLEEPAILNIVLKSPAVEDEVKAVAIEEQRPEPINIPKSYESSGDELSFSYSPSKGKGILKRLQFVGRSISESSLDDYVSSSIDNEGELSASFKKTVRFNDDVKRELYRWNSSILGQKKKNQRKSRNKKRAQERRHSGSELSEIEDKNDEEDEGDRKSSISSDQDKSDDNSDIFDMDMN